MSILRGSLLVLALVASVLPLLAAVAHAKAGTSMPAGSPSPILDYDVGVNPETNLKTTGPYDEEDLYRGPNGLADHARVRLLTNVLGFSAMICAEKFSSAGGSIPRAVQKIMNRNRVYTRLPKK